MKFERTLLLLPIFALAACGDDTEPTDVEPEEVITTVELTATSTGAMVSARWYDADGDGPGDPVITGLTTLAPSTTYALSIRFLNESEEPAENVTEEIEEESDIHQILYLPTGDAIQAIEVTDQDANGLPIGLAATLTTADAPGSGELHIVLKHLPPVDGTPQKTANVGLTDGSTDVDVTIPYTVQ